MSTRNKKTYQFLQAPGREVNNKFFVKVQGQLTGAITSNFFTGYSDFALPDRGRYEGIIANKFSALGGPEVNSKGALDRESESFSVYNSVNYRNYIVRRALDSWLRETASYNPGSPSYHKVNKNGVKIGDRYEYDNWFINHQIPRSDYGYAWISASVTASITSSGGSYSSNFPNLHIGDLGILSASLEDSQIIDFVGLNTFLTRSVNTSSVTLGFTNENSGSLHKYLLKEHGPYGYPSWKQIRNSENPVAISLRKNNKYIVNKKQIIDSAPTKEKEGTAVTAITSSEEYFESPFSYTFVNKVDFKIPKLNIKTSLEAESKLQKLRFHNLSLGNAIDKILPKDNGYDNLLKINEINLTKPDQARISTIEKKDIIFPKRDKIGFKKIRTRPNYAEIAGTGSNGYDRKSSTIRTFWRNNVEDRLQSSPFTAANGTGSFSALGFPETSGNFHYLEDNDANIVGTYTNSVFRSPLSYSFSTWPMDKKVEGAGKIVNYISIFGFILGTARSFSGERPILGALQTTPERYFYFFNQPSGTYSSSLILDDASTQYRVETFKYDPKTKYRVNPTLLFSYPAVINDSVMTSSFNNRIGEHSFEYKTDVLSGKKPFYNSYEDFSSDIRPLTQKYSLVPEYKISDHIDFIVSSSGGNFKSIEYILNNDGYLSLEGRDINSEINILESTKTINSSEEYDEIFENSFKNKEHKLKLKINGIKKLLPYNGFYPQQRTVQLGDLFLQSTFGLKLGQDIEGFYETSNGNTSSMVSSTSNSVGGNGAPLDAQIQTILQPFFAPGILFNTIKSGIAVDWLTVAHPTASAAPYSASFRPNPTGFLSIPDISSSISAGVRLPDFYGITYDNYSKGSNYYLYTRYITSTSSLNLRIPFEGLLDIQQAFPQDFKDKILYLLGPEYYTFDVGSGSIFTSPLQPNRINNLRNPSINLKKLFGKRDAFFEKDQRYKLAMNNFLASTIDFYLEDGKLTSFRSVKQKDIPEFDPAKIYYMDVILKKEENFSLIVNNLTGVFSQDPNFGIGQGKFFGPATRFHNYASFTNGIFILGSVPWANATNTFVNYDPAYAPWTPPYWFGKSIARIAFKPSLPNHSIQEIIESSSVTFINPEREIRFKEDSNLFLSSSTGPTGSSFYNKNYNLSPAYIHAMNLTSSININLIGNEKVIEYDQSGIPLTVKEQPDNSQNFWSIQTKFETPLLNFNTELNKKNVVGTVTSDIPGNTSFLYISSSTLGMWSGYGEIPKQGQSIRIGLQESFEYSRTSISQSLLKHCGFEAGFKDIGRIEDRKEISEAIVLIPYTAGKNHDIVNQEYAETIPPIFGENGKYTDTSLSTGPYYFKVDKKVLSEIIGVNYDVATKQQLENISTKTAQNSIQDTIGKMLKYNIPPHLDWVTNKTVNPFVMYIFEFKSYLSKQDLADIWQGLMPSLSTTTDLESVSLEHKFDEREFFHGKKLPQDIKFKIFKVKKKAKVNYYSLTDSFIDDKKFSFNFSTSETVPNYSYNWPYDFFSLVEAINVEAGVEITKEEE